MSHWVKAREYSTRLEAEIARARLESADIPATIKSDHAGIFGIGFQGAVPSGVELHVPAERLDDVHAILDSDQELDA